MCGPMVSPEPHNRSSNSQVKRVVSLACYRVQKVGPSIVPSWTKAELLSLHGARRPVKLESVCCCLAC